MKDGELVCFRLVTGEYVVGAFVTAKDGSELVEYMTVKDPLIYEIIPGQQPRQFGIQFTPLAPLAKPGNVISIRQSAIMFALPEVHAEVEKRFMTITSGIVVPEKDVKPPALRVT